jgi:hypothetical protein
VPFVDVRVKTDSKIKQISTEQKLGTSGALMDNAMYPKKSPPIEHICIYPAKSKTAAPTAVNPAAAASKQKPEPTLEQRVAGEVARRLNDRTGNFLLGFIIGELFGQWWDQHHRD